MFLILRIHFKLLVLLVLPLVIISESIILLNSNKINQLQSNFSLEVYAEKVIKTCAEIKDHSACYDDQIPKLMDFISMEDAFKVTRIVQQKDKSYGYCHVLGHRLASREVDKNPDKWIEVIHRGPTNGMCANGALHGAVQERFRSEVLTESQLVELEPQLKDACEEKAGWYPTPLAKAICYHGLGHLGVYVTDANFNRALEICDVIGLKEDGQDFRQVCYEGVFMQLFQPLEPEDFDLVRFKSPEKKDLRSFCLKFDSEDKDEACWREGWPLYREEVVIPTGLVDFCSVPPDTQQQNRCYQMLLHTVGQGANFDPQRIAEFCNNMINRRKGECFYNAASSVLEADQRFVEESIMVCSLADTSKAIDECYHGLANQAAYIFLPGSDFIAFCSKFPEPWRDKCSRFSSN